MNKLIKNKKITESIMCPVCKAAMEINTDAGVLYCKGTKRHCYDFSSSGYVNLAPSGKSGAGDSKYAVSARSTFLNKGYYEPALRMLQRLLERYASSDATVVDAGCGEGYYSNGIAENGISVLGFDLSKYAIDASAKRAGKAQGTKNTFFAVSSVYALPIFDGTADALVNIFAPCVEEEYSRVLKDEGTLIIAYAGPEHLLGLKEAVYQTTHINEQRADMPKKMKEVLQEQLEYEITLESREDIQNLFAMTPYYWKTSKEDFEKLGTFDTLTTKIDILFSVYKKI